MDARAPYRVAPEHPAPEPSVTVCRRCGIVAPASGTACEICKTPLGETRVQVPAQGNDTFWVAVRCGFTCNSCKFLAPLDGLDADGAVECGLCGLRQRFEVESWRPALGTAHAVGDLAGPQPEGRRPHPTLWIGSENTLSRVGDTHTFERTVQGVLSLEASPGHPVCAACQVPLTASISGPGVATTSCSRCGDRGTFTLPDSARQLHPAVVAAISSEHRTDRPRAQATATEVGTIALRCPGCGAPLSVQGSDRMQTCPFCKATCIVPARSLMRVGDATLEPSVWWILFHGASERRTQLEAPVAPGPGKDMKAALKMIKPGGGSVPIGEAPGVYEAPEAPGINLPQLMLTLALGIVALAIGWLVLGT